MVDKVEVIDINAESEAEGKLDTLNEEDTPDFNEISETVALEEPNPQEATQEDAVDVKNTEDPKTPKPQNPIN